MQFVYPKFTGGVDKSIRSPYIIVNTESDPRLSYISKSGRGACNARLDSYNKFVHIGQRKLLLAEIQHLAAKLSSKDEKALVVYAGAAPSNKAWILHKLFPNVKFLFVDPNPFNIYINGYGDSHTKHPEVGIVQIPKLDDLVINETNFIYLYNDYFTDETAQFCRTLYDAGDYTKFIFWSDIRTNESEDMPTDLDVLWNSAMMYNWCRIMRPDHAMLKFRCPYLNTRNVNFSEHQADFDKVPIIQRTVQESGNFAFVKGEIHVQAWAGRASTETRLWVEREDIDTTVIYDRLAYEECLFHYNMKTRVCAFHKNLYADMIACFDHCGDCALEAHIWHTYKTRINPKINILRWVHLVEIFTARPLKRAGHGKLFPLENKRNTKMSLKYCSEAAESFFGNTVKPKPQYNPKLNFIPRAFQADFKRLDKPAQLLPPRIIIDTDADPKLPYRQTRENQESAEYRKYIKFVHIGQRKLAMAEVHHLTECLANREEYAVVIYAGAAPTNKHWMEHLMFPNVKFLLVDPAMFNIYIKTYRDSHYKYVNHENPAKGRESVGIVYFGNSNDNINLRYEVEEFDIRYFDGEQITTLKNKYDTAAPNQDVIGSEGDHSAYIDYFYKSDDHIFINEHFFTNGTAEFCRQLIAGRSGHYANCKVLFWCDLRTSDMSDGGHPGDLDILWNSAMVYNWIKIMQPDHAMLKFRVPYGNQSRDIDVDAHREDFALALRNGNDMIGIYMKNGNLLYFPGEIHTQCWKGFDSAETRLWVSREDYDKVAEYDHTDFEQAIFYYNVMERPAMFHENKYANADLGFDNCGDCAIEAYIWNRYKEKHDSNFDIYWWMNWLGEVTTRPLKRGGHGKLLYRER